MSTSIIFAYFRPFLLGNLPHSQFIKSYGWFSSTFCLPPTGPVTSREGVSASKSALDIVSRNVAIFMSYGKILSRTLLHFTLNTPIHHYKSFIGKGQRHINSSLIVYRFSLLMNFFASLIKR